jgi:hypothetical protein
MRSLGVWFVLVCYPTDSSTGRIEQRRFKIRITVPDALLSRGSQRSTNLRCLLGDKSIVGFLVMYGLYNRGDPPPLFFCNCRF